MTARDYSFNKKRTILGFRVLVREEPNGTGIVPANFVVRVKTAGGFIEEQMQAYYYWQAFNHARRMIERM